MSTTTITPNPPKHWHEQADGSLVCPHRDLSVCPDCAASHVEAVDVFGQHFWIADPADRDAFAEIGAVR